MKTLLWFSVPLVIISLASCSVKTIRVNSNNLSEAVQKAGKSKSKKVEVLLESGTYYLTKPLKINFEDFGNKTLTIRGINGDAVLSGGKSLNLNWRTLNDSIWIASLVSEPFDYLYVNEKPMVLARYPNYNSEAGI